MVAKLFKIDGYILCYILTYTKIMVQQDMYMSLYANQIG